MNRDHGLEGAARRNAYQARRAVQSLARLERRDFQRHAIPPGQQRLALWARLQLQVPLGVEPDPGLLAVQFRQRLHDHLGGQHRERIHVPDKGGHIIIAGPGHDVADRTGLDDPATVEYRDLIAEPQRLVHVMGHEQDRLVHACLEREQLVLQSRTDERIERREGLIHQQDVRIGGKGARQPDPLLHAAGQLGHRAIRPLRQSDQFELLIDELPLLLA